LNCLENTEKMKRLLFILILAVLSLSTYQYAFSAPTVRIKDLGYIEGIRKNQLVGIGLVTGLPGKGDSSRSELLKESIANLLGNFGIKVSPDKIRSKNSAVVIVTAEVPGFVRPGDRIDITVSSIYDARSLKGGVLLQAPLKAANGEVYAVAQGRISEVGNEKTVGKIYRGALIEKEISADISKNGIISIVLRNPDFITANSVKKAIEKKYPDLKVKTRDSSLIEVTVPDNRKQDLINLIAEIESIEVKPDTSNRVVIDSNSGVIIIGENVRIGKVAVSYKSVNINIGFSSVLNKEENTFLIKETVSVDDFVETLKKIGLKTEAIAAILKAIYRAGALYGELIVM